MAKVTMNVEADVDAWAPITINNSNGNNLFNVKFTTFSNNDYEIDWGDGTIETKSSGAFISYTLLADSTQIQVRTANGLNDFKELAFQGGLIAVTSFAELANLPNLESIIIIGVGSSLTGNFNEVPSSLKTLNVSQGGFTGSITDLPDLESLTITRNSVGLNYLFSDLPSTLIYLSIGSFGHTINDDISNLPSGLQTLNLNSQGTITGNILNLPLNLISLVVTGSNTITGNILNLPSTLKTTFITGSNTLFGNIEDADEAIESLTILGDNVISGNLQQINSFSSSFGSKLIEIEGHNTIRYTGTTDFNSINGYTSIKLISNTSAITAGEIDQLLIDLNNSSFTKSNLSLIITGNAPARTVASDTAYNALITAGATITLN